MTNKSHLEILASVYEKACLAHSIARIMLSGTRSAGRNALHVAQMDYFSLVFKTLTAYKGITPEMLQSIHKNVESYSNALLTVFKESCGNKNTDAVTAAQNIVQSRYYFVYSYAPKFTNPTPRNPERVGGQNLPLKVYASASRYNYVVEEAKARYQELLAVLFEGDISQAPYIVTADNIHLTPRTARNRGGEDRTNWNHGAKMITSGRSTWTRILEFGLGGMEAFERFVFTSFDLSPQAIRVSYNPTLWMRPFGGKLLDFKVPEKGFERYKELEENAKSISPADEYSAEFGGIVKRVESTSSSIAEDKLHPKLHVFIKNTRFYAQFALEELVEITKNAEFAKVDKTSVEYAGAHSGVFTCENISNVSACIAQANQELKNAVEKQRSASVKYNDWVKGAVVKASAMKKLVEASKALQELTSEELNAVFSAEEIRKLGQLLRKSAKVSK